MSMVPAAQKAIADKPPKNSVAAPVVKSELDADVDRKMRMYGVIQAFRKGRMPDNAQIDETLLYVRDHSPVETKELSSDGKQLIHDIRVLIETARRFVDQKNGDELIQQFLYHTSGAQVKDKKPSVKSPVSEKETKDTGKQALQHLRTLFKLLITNSETRKLLSDAKLVGRTVFADAASNVAERSRPAQDLSEVDAEAPSNEFKDDAAPTEESTKEKGEKMKDSLPLGKDDIKNSTISGNDTNPETAKKTAKSRFQGISSRVPEKHKQNANAELESGKKYFQKQFPKERQDQLIHRLKKVVVECQEHPDYKASISWFFTQLEEYFGRGKRAASGGADQSASSFFKDPTLNQAMSEMRTVLERLANGRSMDGMFNAANKMRTDANNDQELRDWWRRVDSFVRKSFLESGFILEPEFESQTRQLQEESRKFFDGKYKGHLDALLDSVQSWFRAWSEDPLNKRVGDDTNRIVKDLLFDSDGGLTFKPHLWTDIHKVILPALIEKIGYIPIPRVEYTDKDIDVVIENLTIQGRNFLPKIFELNVQNYVKISPYKQIRDEHHHEFTLTLSQVQADMRDVAFYFRTKKGLRMTDSGLADLFLGGKGITAMVQVSSNTKDRESGSIFKAKNVKVSIDTLKFAVRDAKHNVLYRMVSTFGMGFIKKAVSKAISDAIRSAVESADSKLVDIRDRMAAADESEGDSKTKVTKEMRDDQKKKSTSSEKANPRGSQFCIIPGCDNMLLPDKGHKSGWVQKQFERDAAATEGDGWKSKAFSIVPGTV